ncbi:MAG: plasmid pRiA4b ORF-3 family protein, partial [Dehalococcoidia bacterium]
GYYQRVRSETLVNEKGEPRLVWKRRPVEGVSDPTPLKAGAIGPWYPDPENPDVTVRGLCRQHDETWTVTLFLVNAQQEPPIRKDEAWIFQPELIVRASDGESIFIKGQLPPELSPYEAEDRAMLILYRRQVEFAVVHTGIHALDDGVGSAFSEMYGGRAPEMLDIEEPLMEMVVTALLRRTAEFKEAMPTVTSYPSRGVSIYQLKVTLKGAHPPIWRRIQVPGHFTLDKLHLVLQTAMGWENYHLYQFTVSGVYYSEPSPDDWREVKDVRRVTLSQVIPGAGSKFIYEYDFGDSWEHGLKVEKILPPESGVRYPVCTAGKRACPPEDCGGIWTYADLLEIIQDPKHEEHEELIEWVGDEFDPDAFDLEGINRELRLIR